MYCRYGPKKTKKKKKKEKKKKGITNSRIVGIVFRIICKLLNDVGKVL